MRLIPRLFERLPFTFTMLVALLVTSAITDTLGRPITPDQLARWGVGLGDLHSSLLFRLVTSPFHILRPYMAVSISVTFLLFVGACEYGLRTARTAAIFWTTHVVGYAAAFALVAAAAAMGAQWTQRFTGVADVGASNGILGCAGAALILLPSGPRRAATVVFYAYLTAALIISTAIWDIEHVFAFTTGIALGAWLHRRGRERGRFTGVFRSLRVEHRQRAIVLGWIVAVLGLTNVLSAFLLPRHPGWERLDSLLPGVGAPWSRHVMFVLGLALLVLSRGLRRRQKVAWRLSAAILVASVAIHAQVGISHVETVVAAVLVVLFVLWRREFHARSQPATVRRAMRTIVTTAVAVALYGLVGMYLLRSHFSPPVHIGAVVETTWERVFFQPAVALSGDTHRARWFLGSIPLMFWSGIFLAGVTLLRAAAPPPRGRSDEEAAHDILSTFGASGTSYMTLWPGNSLFLTRRRDAYAAYRVNAGVAVVLGDPVGPPDAVSGAVEEFAEFAAANAWDPVFYGATEANFRTYVRLGYTPLKVGEEAVIPLPPLEFRGKRWQDIRTAINRAAREGVRFEMLEGGSVPAEMVRQFEEISAGWSSRHELPEMEFTLGRVGDVADPAVSVAVAVDEGGRVHAFADWLPVPARRGWVIDLMRRRDDSMSGAMDFVIASSLLYFKTHGYEMASLAAAPLADTESDDDESLVRRLVARISGRFGDLYDFKSLFDYKQKYDPAWEPVYLMTQGAPNVVRVAQAIVRAHLPDLDLAGVARFFGARLAQRLATARTGDDDPRP